MADLTQDDLHALENGANVFRALDRALAVAREAFGLQLALAEKRQQLDGIEVEIATRKADVLTLAQQAVVAEQVQRQTVAADEATLAEARYALGKVHDEHRARMKAQDTEYADARGALRKQHADLKDALQTETDHLTRERDAAAKGLAELRAKFATP